VRLRPLTRFICGDDRPKQFCPLFGGITLLMHARRRAERSIPPLQVLYSLTHGHQQFYLPDLEDCPSQRVVQPSNRGSFASLRPMSRQPWPFFPPITGFPTKRCLRNT
jgi:mannose-1-phosphate guanylyltransferase